MNGHNIQCVTLLCQSDHKLETKAKDMQVAFLSSYFETLNVISDICFYKLQVSAYQEVYKEDYWSERENFENIHWHGSKCFFFL